MKRIARTLGWAVVIIAGILIQVEAIWDMAHDTPRQAIEFNFGIFDTE